MDDIDLFVFVIAGCLAVIFNAWIGGLIGGYRGRKSDGLMFGLLLGPIGWIITALLPESGAKCPECLGVVPAAAKRCKHCGAGLTKRVEEKELDRWDAWYVSRGETTEGPFSGHQVKILWEMGKLNGDDLCARKGDAEWKPVSEVIL